MKQLFQEAGSECHSLPFLHLNSDIPVRAEDTKVLGECEQGEKGHCDSMYTLLPQDVA